MGVRFGVSWGRGPYTSTPPPHIRAPHCARRPTIRDGLPRQLTLRFTFTSLSDSVVILWCPSQPSTDGMRRGGVGGAPGSCVASVPPPEGAKIPFSAHPCRVPTTRPWGVSGRVRTRGYPSPTPRATSRVPGGGVGNGAPAPHGVSQRAPPSSVRDFPPPPFCPVLGGAFSWPSAAPWPSTALAVPACCRRPGARCGSSAHAPRGAHVLASASRVMVAQTGRGGGQSR